MTDQGASGATGDIPVNDHDPLSVLRDGDLPVTPDPEFAARLRSRLESALSLPNRTEGVVMSGIDTAIAELNDSPTVAESTRAGSAKRESMPIFGYFGLRYFSTNISSTKLGTSTPSSHTESTCTTPSLLAPWAWAVTTTSCTPLNTESNGLYEFLPAFS